MFLTSESAEQGGSEKLTEEAIESTLEKVVKLLAYISDKDLFSEFSTARSLHAASCRTRSASDDHERSIIARLKQQCGAQFTSKVKLPLTLRLLHLLCCPVHLCLYVILE